MNMETKGDANLLSKLDLKAGTKAASKAASNLESEVKSDIEAKADIKADAKVEAEACPMGKVETPAMPAGQLPNGPITIIDAHRSVHTESPLTAQLAQSVNLLNRLLLTMMGGGGMTMPNMLP